MDLTHFSQTSNSINGNIESCKQLLLLINIIVVLLLVWLGGSSYFSFIVITDSTINKESFVNIFYQTLILRSQRLSYIKNIQTVKNELYKILFGSIDKVHFEYFPCVFNKHGFCFTNKDHSKQKLMKLIKITVKDRSLVDKLIFYCIFFLEYYNNIDKDNCWFMIQNYNKSKSNSTTWQTTLISPFADLAYIQNSYNKKYYTKEAQGEEKYRKFDLTTTQMFLLKAQNNHQEIQSTFQLISLSQNHTQPQLVTLQHLQNLNFPVLKYQLKDLIEFSIKILRTTQFCSLNFTERVTKKLITLLAKNYNVVAYHNFSHAFYFTMLVYQCFTRQYSLKHICTDEEYFYILIAGLCHDINHNGSTNSFQIKTSSHLAKQVKNQSVLQNMHIRHIWKILQENPDLNFIAPSKDKLRAKETVTRLILCTDMAFHNKNLDHFRLLKKSHNFDMKRNAEHKWAVIQQVFHACDIGNPCADYDNYISWGALLSHQFSEVARKQKRMNLQVTKCFEMTTLQSVYKDQVWFINSLVQPIWKELGELFPSFGPMNVNIQKNLKRVKAELQKLNH